MQKDFNMDSRQATDVWRAEQDKLSLEVYVEATGHMTTGCPRKCCCLMTKDTLDNLQHRLVLHKCGGRWQQWVWGLQSHCDWNQVTLACTVGKMKRTSRAELATGRPPRHVQELDQHQRADHGLLLVKSDDLSMPWTSRKPLCVAGEGEKWVSLFHTPLHPQHVLPNSSVKSDDLSMPWTSRKPLCGWWRREVVVLAVHSPSPTARAWCLCLIVV